MVSPEVSDIDLTFLSIDQSQSDTNTPEDFFSTLNRTSSVSSETRLLSIIISIVIVVVVAMVTGRNPMPSGNTLKRNTMMRKSNRSTAIVTNNEQTSPTHVSIIIIIIIRIHLFHLSNMCHYIDHV